MIPDQLRLVPVYLMMVDFPMTGWNLTQTLTGYVFFGAASRSRRASSSCASTS